MKKSTKVLLAGAAMAGLMAGVAARTYAVQTTVTTLGATLSSPGQLDDTGTKGQHECKGKNDCKGQGGCKTDDNACKGHNACKGKGGCNTMPKDK